MDGIPALDLWNLVIEVLYSSFNQPKKSKYNEQGNLLRDTPSRKHTNNQVKIITTILNYATTIMFLQT